MRMNSAKCFYAVTYDNPGILCFGMTSSVKADGNKFFYVPEYSANKEECDKKQMNLIQLFRSS